jgi:excisionase family DNA binding protein
MKHPVAAKEPSNTNAELLTPEQTARKLNISRRCLGNWTRSRVIPMVKIGRVCRFDFPKVKAALEKFEQVEITR